MSKYLLCGLGLCLLWACTSSPVENTIGIAPGNMAPGIVSTDIDGEPFDLSTLRGNYVLLDFWASWCGPCIHEAPQVVALYKEFGSVGLQVVSIAIEKNDKTWQRASEKLGYTWPHQLVEESRYVRFNEIASAYAVTDIPSLFLIDPEGRIIASKIRAEEARAIIAERLAH